MTRFAIRLVINAVALYAATQIVPGIQTQDLNWLGFIGLALIFGVLNALLRPLLTVLTCPLIILTLGIFTLLINTLMFYLAGVIGQALGFGFSVSSFWSAFLGALITSIVSIILSMIFKDELEPAKNR